jgi:hypothetical protein
MSTASANRAGTMIGTASNTANGESARRGTALTPRNENVHDPRRPTGDEKPA